MSENKNTAVALKLNEAVGSVLNQTNLLGFERAYATAQSIEVLKTLLTPEYMAPIMNLQGNRLGFKTDKDKSGGYPADVVKNCLIEAVLMGLQPFGNEFNIIAGNTYATKEGLGRVLASWKGLTYTLVCGVPIPQPDGKSAVVDVTINWTINGNAQKQVVPIAVKMDQYTSVDALIGKATRKGRAWLLSAISGIEITDGDVNDIAYVDVTKKPDAKTVSDEKEKARVIKHIESSKDTATLNRCSAAIKEGDSDLIRDFCSKYIDLSTSLEELMACPLKQYVSAENDYDLFIYFEDKIKEFSK